MSVPEPPLQNLVTLPGFGTFLDHTTWHGVPVALTTLIPDGDVVWIGTPPKQVMIGSRPRTEIEKARYYAKWRVQVGLADVLEWLGERVLPMPPVTGVEVLEGFRRGLV